MSFYLFLKNSLTLFKKLKNRFRAARAVYRFIGWPTFNSEPTEKLVVKSPTYSGYADRPPFLPYRDIFIICVNNTQYHKKL